MTRRVKLHIDTLFHINDLTFHVYRSTEPDVTTDDTLIMKVDQQTANKERYMQMSELLKRSTETPYLFHTHRHYATDLVLPTVYLDADLVEGEDLYMIEDQKEIEIHSGDIGVFDGRPVFMDYEYLAMPLWDDYEVESGKTYIGPPATGLNMPLTFTVSQNIAAKRFRILYTYDDTPIAYYYRIFAVDTNHSISPWSDEKKELLSPSDVFFLVERSPDGKTWENVTLTNMLEWFDDYHVVDRPLNVEDARARPLNSKESEISFRNPWKHFRDDKRTSYKYRVRAEDGDGQYTDWLYFGPFMAAIEPGEIVIRRKVDNKQASSENGIDAFTVFTIRKEDVNVNDDEVVIIDDQLTEALRYSYTFFYTDELEKKADPIFIVSDHTPWQNIILFSSTTQQDIVPEDFVTTFELADEVIEIGIEEA